MIEYLRETWDLHLAAMAAFLCLALILLWYGAISVVLVPVVVLVGAVVSVFGGLWLLCVAGGSLPW